jgi:hypothetical protein
MPLTMKPPCARLSCLPCSTGTRSSTAGRWLRHYSCYEGARTPREGDACEAVLPALPREGDACEAVLPALQH